MLESKFQAELKKEIKRRFPGCIILKNDPDIIQGIPDLLILFENKWAALEIKKSRNASHQPNQDFYVERMNDMSYAAFIYPENREDILDELEQTFRPRRKARVSKRK
jgi:hypothetical protein